jgi:hypothetical protein
VPSTEQLTRPWHEGPNPSGLTVFEVASGFPSGLDARVPSPSPAWRGRSPQEALDAALRPHLERGDCFVAFSGGRDSSAVLAAAASLARREGLRPPIPATLRWPAAPLSHENEWQERVVEHLGLEDWRVLVLDDDVDLLGTRACAALRTYGLFAPAAAVIMLPLIELAAGGTLLLGEGGDDIFEGRERALPLLHALSARRRLSVSEARRAALALSPSVVRRRVYERRAAPHQYWLKPAARAMEARREAASRAQEPLGWTAYLDWSSRFARATTLKASWDRFALPHDTEVVCPFWDPRFLGAIGGLGGWRGLGTRTEAMGTLFGHLLPVDVQARDTKADMTASVWGKQCYDFARQWTGSGLDPDVVDHDLVRRVWLSPRPYYSSALMLHAAWLADDVERQKPSSAVVAHPPVSSPAPREEKA